VAEEVQPGEILQLSLDWRTDGNVDRRYKVFLHLIDEAGQIVSQRDSEPGGGLSLTTIWQPGETIIDNHGLLVPFESSPGQYTLLMGLYDVADPAARLSVTTINGVLDAFPLATIIVLGE
jgi:hypothetical protein